MVAVAIFALLVAAVYSTWMVILKSAQVGNAAAARAQRERIAIRTLEDSLTCIQSFQASIGYYMFNVTNGDQPGLSFVARLPDVFPRNGKFDSNLRRLTFAVESTGSGADSERDLVLRQNPILMDQDADEQQIPLVLAKNVKDFLVECWDTNALDWVDEWGQHQLAARPWCASRSRSRSTTRAASMIQPRPSSPSRAKSPCPPPRCPPSPRPVRRMAASGVAILAVSAATGTDRVEMAKMETDRAEIIPAITETTFKIIGMVLGRVVLAAGLPEGSHNENDLSPKFPRRGHPRGDDRDRGVHGAGGGAGVFDEGGNQAGDERGQRAAAALAGPFRRGIRALDPRTGGVARGPALRFAQPDLGGGPGALAETNSVLAGISLDDFQIGDGKVSLKIIDLERYANINTANAAVLQQALTVMGVDADNISVVSDSIQDWRRRGRRPARRGAESDYYQSLAPPYYAKNAPIDDCPSCCSSRA